MKGKGHVVSSRFITIERYEGVKENTEEKKKNED